MLELKTAVIVPNGCGDWENTEYSDFNQVIGAFGKEKLEIIKTEKLLFVIRKRDVLIYRTEAK